MVRDARLRHAFTMSFQDFAAKKALILRSPPSAGVSKDGLQGAGPNHGLRDRATLRDSSLQLHYDPETQMAGTGPAIAKLREMFRFNAQACCSSRP
jgi:hypothetical protein